MISPTNQKVRTIKKIERDTSEIWQFFALSIAKRVSGNSPFDTHVGRVHSVPVITPKFDAVVPKDPGVQFNQPDCQDNLDSAVQCKRVKNLTWKSLSEKKLLQSGDIHMNS